jgi:L-ascorbate metabolism protein UlaG (beta-lactamase superfamily)
VDQADCQQGKNHTACFSKFRYTCTNLSTAGFCVQNIGGILEISWFGQSAFRLKGKVATVVTDPFKPEFTGLAWPKVEADIVTISHEHEDHNAATLVPNATYVARGPGEYEVKGVAVSGVSSFHDNKEGTSLGQNVIYVINIDGVRVCHLGDLGQDELTSTQLEDIGDVDVLLVPVGGTYTIGSAGAAKVIAQLEPKIVIPMHYDLPGLKHELAPVEPFLKEMGREGLTPVSKLTISSEKLPEEMQVAVLEKS